MGYIQDQISDPCVYQCYAEPPLFCMAWLKRVPQCLRIGSLIRLPTMYLFCRDWITGSAPLEPNLGVWVITLGMLLMALFVLENWVKGFNKFRSQPFNKQIISTYVLKLRSCKMWFKSIFIIFQYDRILPESDKKIWWITEWWSVSSDLITQERCKVIQSETTQHNTDYNNILPYTVIMVVTRC